MHARLKLPAGDAVVCLHAIVARGLPGLPNWVQAGLDVAGAKSCCWGGERRSKQSDATREKCVFRLSVAYGIYALSFSFPLQ